MISSFDTNNLDFSQSRWNGVCPDCQKQFDAELEFIGQSFECECGHSFLFPWWNPVPTTIIGTLPLIFNTPQEKDLIGATIK
jgi:hypothetical protein